MEKGERIEIENMKKTEKLLLPQVTLCAMTSVQVRATVKAMKYSMRGIEFGDAVLITHKKPWFLPKNIKYKHTSKLTDINQFNYKTVYEMGDYIDTDFALLVHYDGYVVHPEKWRKEFLDYDYIGSPWPLPKPGDTVSYRDRDGNLCRVGNSVGIRSKRLMEFPKKAGIEFKPDENGWYNEDTFICCTMRKELEEAGMKIAPFEIAKYFGKENILPENKDITPFLFHKWYGENAQYPDFRHKPSPLRPVLGRMKRRIFRLLHISGSR